MPREAVEAVAKRVAPAESVKTPKIVPPPPVAPVPEKRKPEIAELLFDAKWYLARYPDVPMSDEEAYRNYLAAGMKMGHFPNSLFESVRFPPRTAIPTEHRYHVTASPIMCRVPSTRYLELYRLKKRVHRLYSTLTEYLRRAVINPDLINAELWENDLRIAAYMDGLKNRLAVEYSQKSQDELVSIILVTRNGTKALEDAIVSVLMQSYENWELMVVDDASEGDGIEPLITQFNDPRLKYIRTAEEIGSGSARNFGIAHSSGTAIAYLDDNTVWDPDCILVLLNQMRAHGARASYGAQVRWSDFDPDARLGRGLKSIRFSPFNRSLLENTDYISLSALIHERALLDEVGMFDTSLKAHADWDFVLRLTEGERPVAMPCLLSHAFLQDPAHITPEAESVPPNAAAIPAGNGRADAGVPANETSSVNEISSEIVAAESTITAEDEEKIHLAEMRAKFAARSDWTQPFSTTDGNEHLAFSISRRARENRSRKLAKLPVAPVQILIPNYESLAEIEMCLRSIAEHTSSPYQVVVIDNGSSEETYAELTKLPLSFENVRVIQENKVSGFTFAVNRGLAEIADRNEQILILNNDTLVTPDWLNELQYVLFKHSDAGMAVPRQVLPANTKAAKIHMPAATNSIECDINLSVQHDNILDPEFDPEDDLVELSYAPLFCGLVRPETIKTLGMFDSGNGPHYRSDWIFCDSMRRFLNQRIIYTPHSKVYHLQGVATRSKKASEEALLRQAAEEALLRDAAEADNPATEAGVDATSPDVK